MKSCSNDDDDNGFAKWGGYMAAKKTKLQQQFSDDIERKSAQGKIFAGVAIFVNGYTRPTAEELKQIMLQHGGTYHHYQSSRTTHVIASNLPDSKVRQLKDGSRAAVVRPQWVTDSLAAGQLLDHRDYLLCETQSRLSFQPSREAREPARLASDKNFLGEFYSNSRLHHISTMGATFKQYVGQLRAATTGRFPGRDRLRTHTSSADDLLEHSVGVLGDRVIMHIDMDCFFVSVGLRSRPHLRGLPVAVTHARGNPVAAERSSSRQQEFQCYKQQVEKKLGEAAAMKCGRMDDVDDSSSMSEVASCSYEARQAGVKNGMFLGTALKLCPNLRTIPYDFNDYKQVSYILYDTVTEYTLDIEAVSCDEMFVDCTELLRETEVMPLEFATILRQEIKLAGNRLRVVSSVVVGQERTDCTASTGFGGNALLARLATRRAKPNGQFALLASDVDTFIQDIRVDDLPGVGPSVSARLRVLDVETCGQLQEHSVTELQARFGAKLGRTLHEHCRGRDNRALHTSGQHQRKSVSAEVNYGIRLCSRAEADDFLRRLAEEVSARLAEVGLIGRCITLKLMVRSKDAPVETAKFLGHGVCDSITRSSSLAVPIADHSAIAREVLALSHNITVPPGEWRGVGIQVSRLEKRSVSSSLEQFLSRPPAQPPSPPSTSDIITLSQVDPSFLEALPADVRREVEGELMRTKQHDTPVLATDMPLPEAEAAVRAWVCSCDQPEQYDVYMMADYVERLVACGSTHTLRSVLLLLQACTAEKLDSSWQAAYEAVHECAQEMLLRCGNEALGF